METNTNYIISVKDLVKEYNDGKVTALSHCNLDVKKGEVVGRQAQENQRFSEALIFLKSRHREKYFSKV